MTELTYLCGKLNDMRNLFMVLFAALTLAACNQKTEENKTITIEAFGAQIDTTGSKPMSDVASLLGSQDSAKMKLTGIVEKCCQKKGCWMTIQNPNGDPIQVQFKDYGFFVPKESAGKVAYMDGWAYKDTISVEEQQHYAEDEGKSPEEIAKITEPKVTIRFMADGVILKEEKTETPTEEKH